MQSVLTNKNNKLVQKTDLWDTPVRVGKKVTEGCIPYRRVDPNLCWYETTFVLVHLHAKEMVPISSCAASINLTHHRLTVFLKNCVCPEYVQISILTAIP